MGAAWAANRQFPWQIGRYLGGIENVKINVTLRIYSNKWHVYAGLAILNPSAGAQIRQYAESVTELFKLMLGGQREEFAGRVRAAGAAVFGRMEEREAEADGQGGGYGHGELLLEDSVLDRFSLGEVPVERVRNNHLSLLGMVDCWWKLGIVPYEHMICSTPVSLPFMPVYRDIKQHARHDGMLTFRLQLFRLWLGAAEYLFRKPELLEEAIDTAMEDNTFRADDLEFTFAARVSLCWTASFGLRSLTGINRIGANASVSATWKDIGRSSKRCRSISSPGFRTRSKLATT